MYGENKKPETNGNSDECDFEINMACSFCIFGLHLLCFTYLGVKTEKRYIKLNLLCCTRAEYVVHKSSERKQALGGVVLPRDCSYQKWPYAKFQLLRSDFKFLGLIRILKKSPKLFFFSKE
jgi:hypothetical protein